jgi:tetratricopeptide (TPR) repeat protein
MDSQCCCQVLRARVLALAGMLDAGPANALAWHRLGITLVDLGDRAGALLALRNALLLDSTHAPTHRALGALMFDCGQVEHALRCFEHASLHEADGHEPPML